MDGSIIELLCKRIDCLGCIYHMNGLACSGCENNYSVSIYTMKQESILYIVLQLLRLNLHKNNQVINALGFNPSAYFFVADKIVINSI